jgi:hypothetical protein
MLVLSVFATPAAAEKSFENPLRPPDTLSPRATLQSFLDNSREAYDVLMPAYASYLAEPSLFSRLNRPERRKSASRSCLTGPCARSTRSGVRRLRRRRTCSSCR